MGAFDNTEKAKIDNSKTHDLKVILLDVDNTLLDFNRCAEVSMQKTFTHFGMTFDAGILPLFTEVNNHLWGEIEKGLLTKEGLYKVRWDMVFEHIEEVRGVNPAKIGSTTIAGIDFEKIFLSHLATASEKVDGAQELLDFLSKKYILCVASNAPYKQQTSRLQGAGLLHYFDKLFISEQIGYAKPSNKFFEACMAELPGVLPNEVIIIGDSLHADISGGINHGMLTCWFDRDGLLYDITTRSADNNSIAPPADYVVHALSEIIDIL